MGDMQAIEEFKKEVSELCDEVANGLEELKNTKVYKGQKRDEKINVLKNRLNRAKQALRSLKVEFREFTKLDQKPHADRAAVLEERINALTIDLEFAEKNDPEQQKQDAAMTTDYNAVLNKGKQIQETDIQMLNGMTRKLEEAEGIGADTLAEMHKQTGTMVKIDKDMDEIQSNLKLASKQVRVMVRKLATDKIIMCFMCMIFAGIIVIIVYSVVDKNAKTNVPQSVRTT